MEICDKDFWEWVDSHISDDTFKLRLRYSHSDDAPVYDAAIRQIECRQRFGKKLAQTLAEAPHFYFPTQLSGEQSTSDTLADFHSGLVIPGQPMIDLTSGLGIDVLHCSRQASEAVAVEAAECLANAFTANAALLKRDNISVVCDDCRNVVSSIGRRFATAFIDPARRSADGGRLFSLDDCEPDVTAMLPDLARLCRRLIVKMSPMLDITHTLSQLDDCHRIIALGSTTECKELIAVIDFGNDTSEAIIEGTTIRNTGETISFSYTRAQEEACPTPLYSVPQAGDYLYEPYPAVMKLGAHKLIAERFGLRCFHPNTRLYHSPRADQSFPGDIFRIDDILDFSSKIIKRLKNAYPQINVAARNFGMSAEDLRKKLGVKDGGAKRLIALTDHNSVRRMLVVSSLKA